MNGRHALENQRRIQEPRHIAEFRLDGFGVPEQRRTELVAEIARGHLGSIRRPVDGLGGREECDLLFSQERPVRPLPHEQIALRPQGQETPVLDLDHLAGDHDRTRLTGKEWAKPCHRLPLEGKQHPHEREGRIHLLLHQLLHSCVS